MLQNTFIQLCSAYTNDNSLIQKLWNEIETAYSNKKRYYHTLSHLEFLFQQLTNVKEKIQDWHAILFSIFYHDIFYHVLKKDNEEQSALLAEKRLSELTVSENKIAKCKEQILATKSHNVSNDNDTNLFTDADLSILGQGWNIYETYTKQIRKEYSVYPGFIYKPARKKVLLHFLEMEKIFKTDKFYNLLEKQARENITREIEEL